MTITNGGILQFTVASPTINIGGTTSGGYITGGTLSYLNVGGVNMNDNTNGGTAIGQAGFVWSGSNTLRLDGSSSTSDYAFGGTGTTYNALELINGTASGAITVNSGGSLSGTGIVGTLNVNSGGTLAPGASIGTLAVGDTTIGGIFSVDVDNTGASDLLNVTGDLILGGASSLSIVDINQLAGSFYTIATYTGTGSGTFAGGDNLPGSWYVDYGTGSNSAVTLMPEPATMALLGLGGLGLLFGRKRR